MGLPTLCLVKEGLIEEGLVKEGLVKEGLIEESLVKRQSGPRGSVEFARVGTDGTRRLGGLVLLFAIGASAPLAAAEWRHGLSFFGEFKYDAGFQHFDYVQPDAPQGGRIRYPELRQFRFGQSVHSQRQKSHGNGLHHRPDLRAIDVQGG